MGPRRTVVLVALLLTAGCTGVFGQGTPTPPDTPAPVPTTRPEPAPGVSGDALVAPATLAAANARALNGTAYRLERSVAVEGPNGTLRVDRTQAVAADGTALGRLSVGGDGPVDTAVRNWTRYRTARLVYARTTLADGRTVQNRLLSSDASPFLLGRELPERLFAAGTYTVAGRTDAGVVLRSTGPFALSRGVTEVGTSPPRNVTVRATVTDAGLVRRLRVAYDANVGSARVRVRVVQTVRVDATLTVDRPAWVPRDGG